MKRILKSKKQTSNSLCVGDMVLVNEIPGTLLAGLPIEDQVAISLQKGKIVELLGFDDYGFAELDFFDDSGNLHTIWIEPTALEKACMQVKKRK